jgi:hypothetical protein
MKITHRLYYPGYTYRIPNAIAGCLGKENSNSIKEDIEMRFGDDMENSPQKINNIVDKLLEDDYDDTFPFYDRNIDHRGSSLYLLTACFQDGKYEEKYMPKDNVDNYGKNYYDVLGNKVHIDNKIVESIYQHQPNVFYGGILVEQKYAKNITSSTFDSLGFCGFFPGYEDMKIIIYDTDKAIIMIEYDTESG